jgi:hypothetical protein
MLPRHRLSCNTLGPDGFEDLNLKFKTQDVIEAMGNLGNDKRVFWTLELKFNLLDGTELQGTDVVVFLNNKKK